VTAPIRILVCEDSATYALGLKRFLETGGDIEVVAVCGTGEEALEAVPRLAPDLVTMDLDLPGMGGIRAVEQIMRSHAVPIVVLSGQVRRGSSGAAEALSAGALEALPKAQVRIEEPAGPAAVALRFRFKRLAAAKVSTPNGAAPAPSPSPSPPSVAPGSDAVSVIGICASTGGPRALETVLAGLPASFPIPVLVVQHMTPGFTEGLASWLDRRTPLPVALARGDHALTAGVWIAPDGAHLKLDTGMTLALDPDTADGHHRPSGDLLFASMAAAAGAGVVGVVLTGMGRDGARGVEAVRRAGGRVIAQDETTSAIFGMPRAAVEAGADVVLPIGAIAGALVSLAAVETAA
jgi:two-component system, chemotaxis family, protein-glutamate methylesterase/glutaminase